MITLLGTSHVSKKSAQEAKLAIAAAEIVCLELDERRAHGLLNEAEASFGDLRKHLGLKGAIIATILRSVQKNVANKLGVVPGVELRAALIESARLQKQIFLIDRDISITMRRLSKAFGWREAWQMIKDTKPRKIPVNPSDDLVEQLMGELATSYPGLYAVLVNERDKHMANLLMRIQDKFPEKNVLAIMGKGHVMGVMREININSPLPVSVWHSPKRS